MTDIVHKDGCYSLITELSIEKALNYSDTQVNMISSL